MIQKITNIQRYTSLLLFITLIYYLSFYSNLNSPILSNHHLDKETERKILDLIFFYIKSAFVLTIIAGIAFIPDSIMIRPHPILWRILYSIAFFYLLLLILLCLVHSQDTKYLLRIFDDNLNKPLEYKSYGDNCNLSSDTFPYIDFSVIYKSIDVYVLAHLVGWFVKYISIRDFKFAMFMSIFFEIMEMTFQHLLNNFIECWWDHLLLDIFGMNLLGIILGYYFIEYFNAKRYSWGNIKMEENNINKSVSNKLVINNNFLSPYFINYDWSIFKSSSNFFGVIWLVLLINACELSHFFLKSTLYLPVTHYLLFIRILMWGFLCIIAVREYYDFITISYSRKFGQFLWLTHAIIFTEWLLIYKVSYQNNLFDIEYPLHVTYFWITTFLILGVIGLKLIYDDFKRAIFNYQKGLPLI